MSKRKNFNPFKGSSYQRYNALKEQLQKQNELLLRERQVIQGKNIGHNPTPSQETIIENPQNQPSSEEQEMDEENLEVPYFDVAEREKPKQLKRSLREQNVLREQPLSDDLMEMIQEIERKALAEIESLRADKISLLQRLNKQIKLHNNEKLKRNQLQKKIQILSSELRYKKSKSHPKLDSGKIPKIILEQDQQYSVTPHASHLKSNEVQEQNYFGQNNSQNYQNEISQQNSRIMKKSTKEHPKQPQKSRVKSQNQQFTPAQSVRIQHKQVPSKRQQANFQIQQTQQNQQNYQQQQHQRKQSQQSQQQLQHQHQLQQQQQQQRVYQDQQRQRNPQVQQNPVQISNKNVIPSQSVYYLDRNSPSKHKRQNSLINYINMNPQKSQVENEFNKLKHQNLQLRSTLSRQNSTGNINYQKNLLRNQLRTLQGKAQKYQQILNQARGNELINPDEIETLLLQGANIEQDGQRLMRAKSNPEFKSVTEIFNNPYQSNTNNYGNYRNSKAQFGSSSKIELQRSAQTPMAKHTNDNYNNKFRQSSSKEIQKLIQNMKRAVNS